jgi:L-fuculose-phosphate aldolase
VPKPEAVVNKDLVDQLIDVAQRVVASGAISANGHGNVSLRVPDANEMYFTAGPSLRGHAAAAVVRVGLDGTLLEGDLPPIQGAVVAMHTAMYADHPDVGCVLHTHSPYATAYAVAHRPIGCWVEALAMFGLPTGVPVASYGPRGSDQAVANIRAAITPGVPAVLLANHGVLVFHRTPELAIVVGGIVEEAAQAGINAANLGGPVEVPEELRAAALQRAMTFEAIGTVHA